MANLTGRERSRYVQAMFGKLAPHYDWMNRLMTGGQDMTWRREVIRLADLHPAQRVLDLGAGTGDLSALALKQCPGVEIIAADYTLAMMQMGKQRQSREAHPRWDAHPWLAADALCLPFADERFDAVISGFLIRNVADLDRALAEQYRILKPGGRIVILETTPPPRSLLAPMIRFYLQRVIPALGQRMTRQSEAYTYLSQSTTGFIPAEALTGRMAEAGFRDIRCCYRMFKTVAIHCGLK